MDIRVSCGSEAKLGLRKIRVLAPSEIVYLLTRGICHASCDFCSQSGADETKKLSRVNWNVWEFDKILPLLHGQKRVCIQCLNYPEVYEDLLEMVKRIKAPISISAQPFSLEEMHDLSKYVDKISISLDCFTRDLFKQYKSFYDWDLHWTRLKKAVEIFGTGNVISHLIVGLGESEFDAVKTMDKLFKCGALPSLFAFTPIKGTKLYKMDPPKLGKYRRLQIVRHLLLKDKLSINDIKFDRGRIVSIGDSIDHIESDAFRTQGCPDCNRPYYNEVPGHTIYNYPYELPDENLKDLLKEAGLEQ